MTPRWNIQHAPARRMPWSVRVPIITIVALIPVLLWELSLFWGS